MPKWKSSYDSQRKYKCEWERTYLWVKEAPDGKGDAYCKLCLCNLNPRISVLQKHEQTEKHKKRQSVIKTTRPVTAFPSGPSEDVKKTELELAVAISCHCSIKSVDHLGEIMKKHGKGSALGNIALHRTKCSRLITEAISPAFKHMLMKDIKDEKFALLVDESTDVSTEKHLCIVIQYFSKTEKRIVTELVALVAVTEATSETLFNAIKAAVQDIGQTLSNCLGFASDGASVMVGNNNSVWTRIQAKSPNCVQMRCICHFLALCVQHTFNKLPPNLGFLLSEIPKWFSKSSLRREAYKSLFNIMNPDDERKGIPTPFQQPAATRWLVRGKVMNTILCNWEELHAYFTCAEQNCGQEVKFKARMLEEMLADGINKLYFHCITPIVMEFEQVIAFFQATDLDPQNMENELNLLYKAMKSRIFTPKGDILNQHQTDYGARFVQEVSSYLKKNTQGEAMHKVGEVQSRCHSFIMEAVQQLEKRLPPSRNIFKPLSNLHPSVILIQVARPVFLNLPFVKFLEPEEMDRVERQYRNMIVVNWREASVFSGNIPLNSVQFWVGVSSFQNGMGEHPFQELSKWALSSLVTLASNAIVERIFSHVTNVKTKLRNRMSTKMLDAIVRIRCHLQFQGLCCKDFVLYPEMLKLFNSDIYNNKNAGGNIDNEDIYEYM